MLSKQRVTLLAIVLQAAALVLIGQTWYSISMSPEGHAVVLGDYSGSAANPSALATSAFSSVAILVLAFSQRVALRISAALACLANLALMLFAAAGLFNRDISALDSELDRLTGIAGTHGISGLEIAQQPTGWIWIGVELLLVVLLAYAAIVAPQVVRSKSNDQLSRGKRGSVLKASEQGSNSAIDLWDDQRR